MVNRKSMTESGPKPSSPAILVVDDEPGIIETLKKRLVSWGFRVTTAEHGRRALALMQDAVPDLLVTDLFMPKMTGFELMRHVRETLPELPVIVMSGQGEVRDVIQALRLGAWDYIYKPVEEMAFIRIAIERVLEKARLKEENNAYRDRLEELVAQKSAKLLDQQQVLIDKSVSLERTNEALKSLLDQREIEKKAIEQTMVGNLKRFVFPYLDALAQLSMKEEARTYLDIIRTNIDQLISPVSKSLGGAYSDLTPTEVKVADLIRQGQPTKAIAALLNTSPSTVEKHRNKIRKKLGILNKNKNLQTFLNSLT
jgi:FixJ family two-component response regulator